MTDEYGCRPPHSAQTLMEDRTKKRERAHQQQQERTRAAEQSVAPIVEELRALVKETQDQNEILQTQVDSANKEAKRARILAIVSLVLSTLIALASLGVTLWEQLG